MTHPFEISGHGKAPFRCIGVEEKFFRLPDGTTKAAGTCDHCGTGIRWAFQIVSSCGHKFHVGCDCVEKVDLELFRSVKRVRRAHDQEARLAKFRVSAAEKRAKIRAERRELTRQELFVHPELLGQLFAERKDLWCRSQLRSILRRNVRISDQFAKLIKSEIARIFKNREEDAINASSQHVGQIGERITRTLTCLHKISGGNQWQPWTLSILTDGQNIFTTFGQCPLWKDDTATVKFTIKAHNERDGVKQTQIIRIK